MGLNSSTAPRPHLTGRGGTDGVNLLRMCLTLMAFMSFSSTTPVKEKWEFMIIVIDNNQRL